MSYTTTEQERIDNFKNWYTQKQTNYEEAANYVYEKLKAYLREQKFVVANVCTRVKTIDSALEKAKKMTEKNGEYVLKYTNPRHDIEDFAGVRIIVYMASEMDIITDAVERLFADNVLYDSSGNKIDLLGEDKVGYLSIHYVVTINTGEQQYKKINGLKCEIQIRTVLQDAWAQIFHDRLYKENSDSIKDIDIRRKTNLVAGSLELLDSRIDELVKYYDSKDKRISNKAYQALLNEEITEKSLSEYCAVLSNGKVEKYYSYKQVKELLSSVGIRTIRELDYHVDNGFIRELIDMNVTLTIDRVVRYILLISDYKKFFSIPEHSINFIINSSIYDLLNKYIDMKEICKQYKNLIINEGKEHIHE